MKSFKTTAVATTALCALLGACTSVGKPLYPIDDHAATPPVAAPAPPPVVAPPAPAAQEDTAPLARPTQRIESTNLGPPPGAREAPPPEARAPEARPATTYAYPAARPARAPTQLAQAAAPPVAAAPAMVMQKAPGSGPVKTETPEPVKVKKGDTLIAISHRTGIFVADLADENDLKKPYRLKPGSSIKLPSKRYYLVQNGDTLYSVARRFGLEAKALAEFNKFEVGASVRGGQKLYLPADAKDKGVPKPIMVAAPAPKTAYARPSPAEEAQAPPVREAPPPVAAPDYEAVPRRAEQAPSPPPAPPIAQAVPVAPRAPVVPPRAAAPPPAAVAGAPSPRPPAAAETAQSSADADVSAAGRGVFQWPVRGEMIAPFGPKGATRNDGIDLGATKGDSVRSAAAGEVVYAGNAVQGFGNLVLIKHDGGWVTAYAHLANIEVKMRQQVVQGQEIGLVGETGGVDRPQLHFEIRYAPTPKDKARPIDPMLVLPVQ